MEAWELAVFNRMTENPPKIHGEGTADWGLGDDVLNFIFEQTRGGVKTLETGCGISTMVFALKGTTHFAITPSTDEVERIRQYCLQEGIPTDKISFRIGKSEDVLPNLEVKDFDIVLIDGCHGFPVPFLDWYYLSERLKVNGLVIIDDIQLWPCRVLCDFLKTEPEWAVESIFSRSMVFRKLKNVSAKEWTEQPFIVGTERLMREIAALRASLEAQQQALVGKDQQIAQLTAERAGLTQHVAYFQSAERSRQQTLTQLQSILRSQQQSLTRMEKEVTELVAERERLSQKSFGLQEALQIQEQYVSTIEDSLAWMLVVKYRRLRNNIFPAGTRRHKVYNSIKNSCKRVVQGPAPASPPNGADPFGSANNGQSAEERTDTAQSLLSPAATPPPLLENGLPSEPRQPPPGNSIDPNAIYFDPNTRRKTLGEITVANQAAQLLLRQKYRELLYNKLPLPELEDTEFRCFSQNGEDGILLYIFSILGTTNRCVVEICAGDGIECNSANLIVNHGWYGLLFDADEQNIIRGSEFYLKCQDTFSAPPTLVAAWITAENVNSLILENGFAGDIDLLSLDMDGMDYWVWRAIQCISPRVIILEFNPAWGPERAVAVPYQADFRIDYSRRPLYAGASLPAFVKLGREKGYRFVGTQRLGFNALFVRSGLGEDLLPEITPTQCFQRHPILRSWGLHWIPDPSEKPEWKNIVEV
jgi:Methyltransferase domain